MKRGVHKKTIAFFAERLCGGGVEKILDIILRHIDRQHFSVTVFSSREEGEYQPLNGINYNYYFETLNSNDGHIASFVKRINNKIRLIVYYHFPPCFFYRLFVRKRFETVVAFIEGYATRIASGAPKGTKKIAWVHADMRDYHWSKVAFRSFSEEKTCYDSFEKVICVSQKVKFEMVSLFGTGEKTIVLYNPIDIEDILKKAQIQIGVKRPLRGEIRLLTVGSLVPVKGFMRLLICVRKLCDDGLDLNLTIVGEGPERQQLENKVHSLSLDDRVLFTGFEPNPYPYFLNTDIFVSSSFAEGFSTVISEALILGLPIVATECSGVKEQLGNSQWGLITANDDNALCEGIARLASNEQLRKLYSTQAIVAGQRYSLLDRLIAIESLLSE